MAVHGDKDKNQWKRVDKAMVNDPNSRNEIMLTTDLCMAFKNNPQYDECTRKKGKWYYKGMTKEERIKAKKAKKRSCREGLWVGTQLDPHTENCCTWQCVRALTKAGVYVDGQENEYCGITFTWTGKTK